MDQDDVRRVYGIMIPTSSASVFRTIRYWAGSEYKHRFFLVFADHTQAVDISTWQTIERDLKDVRIEHVLGLVTLPAASQPKTPFDVHTIKAMFGSEVHLGAQVTRGQAGSFDKAVAKVREDHAALVAEKLRYDSDPAYALEQELKVFDWTTDASDDHRVVRAGEAHLRRIHALKARVDPTIANALFAKYTPIALTKESP